MSNIGWAGNAFEVRCCMASRMDWHLQSRLAKIKNKVDNITKTATSLGLLTFIPH